MALDLDHREDRLDRAFEEFHRANPQVMDRLVALATQARRRGVRRIGIGMLFEVLRWEHAIETSGDEFRLNNNLRSRYARRIMADHPELDGIFETRELRPPVPRSLAVPTR
jgi:hypothetical protein